LTNLTMLTVDTSFWIRYRSTGNPDFGDTFPQFIDIVNRTAIPLRDNYTADENPGHRQHRGVSLPVHRTGRLQSLHHDADEATALDTVRIIAGIAGVEVAHFTVWHDKAGNAPPVSVDGLVFPDMETFNGDELRQKNLIMPSHAISSAWTYRSVPSFVPARFRIPARWRPPRP